MMEKPDIDHIEGLSPAISIEQKSTSHNPRSTVGTITEIYDYLRLLFARVGEPHCPEHGTKLEAQTVSQMVDQVMALPEGARVMVLAPIVRERRVNMSTCSKNSEPAASYAPALMAWCVRLTIRLSSKKTEALYRCCGGQTEDQTWAGAAPCGKLRDCNPASRRAGHGGAYWR